jgi:hypothetical protein
MGARTRCSDWKAKFVGFFTKLRGADRSRRAGIGALVLACLFAVTPAAQSQPAEPTPDPNGPANIFYGAVPPDSAKAPLLVFVHGLKGIAADWWVNAIDGSPNPMYEMAWAAGYRTAFVSFDPNNKRDATKTWLQNGDTLKTQLLTIAAHYSATSMYLVTHSMGGLSAEKALLNSTLTGLDPTVAPLIKAVFTLATPNQGTPLADWAFGKGKPLAILFGLYTPAVQSLEVGTVTAFRATVDPILANSGIEFYTFGGNSFQSKDPIILATGLILSGMGAKPNDSLVPLSSVHLPYSYAMNVGQTNGNHYQMIEGTFTFPIINPIIQNLERQIPGFKRIATGGFGDDANTFTWSMKWFKGKLYVGTGREVNCITLLTSDVQNGTHLYPPPNGACPTDPRLLPLAAQIWQYTPSTHNWQMVYQSPQDIPLGTDSNGNPIMTARDIGYRGMEVFTEPDGTQSLYVGSVTSAEVFGNTPPYTFQNYPPPRILRSTDGVNWTPLPQDPGTYLGDLTKNYAVHTFSIRSLVSYKGMLYATAGTYFGDGMVIASANPSAGNNAWFQASPTDDQFPVWDMAVFNDRLYAVGGNTGGPGYFVAWTDGQGVPPFTWNYVINNGAHVSPLPGPDGALSLAVFNNQLYVGTDGPPPLAGNLAGGSELIRINPDNSWEQVVGNPYTGTSGPINPVTGIGEYFDNQFNRHFWRMTVVPAGAHQGLYLGTFDNSVQVSVFWEIGNLVVGDWGTDLMMTPDGTHWKMVTTTGFGDGFNHGTRSIESTPFGIVVGTGRMVGGTQIWIDQTVLDFNGDGVIDQTDVNTVQSAVGQAAAANDPRDLDQDGKITSSDVQLLSTQCTYANCAPSAKPLVPKPSAPANLIAANASDSGGEVQLSWNSVPGAVEYKIYRQTNSPLLQIFPPQGVTIKFEGIPILIPQAILSGKLDKICPPGAGNDLCTYVYLVEAANQPGNQVGAPSSLDYLGSTSGTTFQETPPSPLQSLYFVRAQDAAGNLSDPSNVVGAPSFATVPPSPTVASVTESPSALVFSTTAGSSVAIPTQSLQIATEGGSTPLQFNASVSIISPLGGSWLQLAQTTGTAVLAPAAFSLGVTANATGLQAGTYLATITVKGQDGSSHPVTVTLNVASSSGSGSSSNSLVVSQNALSFVYTIGGGTPKNQTFTLANSSTSLSFAVLALYDQPASNGWLQIDPSSGTTAVLPASTTISVGVNPNGLVAGNYSATLLVADTGGNVQNVIVTLVVSPGSSPPSVGSTLLATNVPSLSFTYTIGGTQPSPQSLQVNSSAVLGFDVKALGSNHWLGVSPVSGTTPTSLTVTASPRNLPPGTYSQTLEMTPVGTITHQIIPVTLTITSPAPPPPAIVAGQIIPHVANGGGWSSSILLVNNSTTPQQFTISFFADGGAALILPLGADGKVSSVIDTIPPGGQRLIQSDGSGLAVAGWAGINSTSSVGAFVTLYAPANGAFSAASMPVSTTPGQQLFLPFDQTFHGAKFTTGVALSNPNATAAVVTFVFTDDAGRPIAAATATVTVPGYGHYSTVLDQAFPAVAGKRGVAVLTSTQPICGVGIRFDGSSFTTLNALTPSTATSEAFAHVVNGAGWNTTFLLINTGMQSASFTLSFRGNDSSAWKLPLGSDGNQSSVTGAIAPGTIRILQSDGSGATMQQGWASLSTTGSVSGTAIFSVQAAGQPPTEASVPIGSAGATQLYLPFDQTSPEQSATGVALANPNAGSATVYLTFAQSDGQQTPVTQPITIPAGGHWAGVLGDLYPAIQGKTGIAYLVSDVPLLGVGIQFKGQAYISIPLLTLGAN